MRALRYITILCMLLAVASFNACTDDNEQLSGAVTGQSWQENKPLDIIPGQELSVSFNANGNWTATSNADWCQLLDKEGHSGQSTLRILVATAANASRTATITIRVEGYRSASFQVTQSATGGASDDMAINLAMDTYLREKYLWNDEYKTLKLDFTKNYSNFLQDALMSMTTNTLDKRKTQNGDYYLFSFIEQVPSISSSRATKHVEKKRKYSFGITGLIDVRFDNGSFVLYVRGVHPDSPAAAAGLKRGTAITGVNGQKLTNINIANQYYVDLQVPNASLTLQITDSENHTQSLTAAPIYVNPVIFEQVEEINGHQIGYLVYSEFDASFDEELFSAFKSFKSQNVTDLILDLRYNGGGHTISANLIASCIAGSATANKTFASYRYNDDRMKAQNNKRSNESFGYLSYGNLGTSLAAGGLNLRRVYCLVGNGTASASELVINSLKGIGVEVILIGEKTTGKNVGMEPTEIEVGGHKYNFLPITFQTYNDQGFGAYEAGFTPNKVIDETAPDGNTQYFTPPIAYGADTEPLYAAAVEMITGMAPPKSRGLTRLPIKGQVQTMEVPTRPGWGGLIKLPTE